MTERLFARAPGLSNQANYRHFPRDPAFPGIQYAREVTTPLATYADGPYALLTYRMLTAVELDTMLTLDGFTSESVREVDLTVRLPNQRWTAGVDYNCRAVRPVWGAQGGRDQLYYHGVVYRLYRLVAI